MLTRKAYNYSIFRSACLILNNDSITTEMKDNMINDLLNNKHISDNYTAPVWNYLVPYGWLRLLRKKKVEYKI